MALEAPFNAWAVAAVAWATEAGLRRP